ncbi:MAG: hypothetical protein HY783_10375 [Chloroflexi bacterium]|nr:hypothetical protein [Chloroflexota bacterium]
MKKETARQASIRCPIGLFPRQEEEIARLTREIDQARAAAQKAPWAQALFEAVDVLLACEQYDEESLDCRLCRNFSGLRRKTATLVIKAGRLDDRRRRTADDRRRS